MQLVLVLFDAQEGQRTFVLQPGINRLGSAEGNQIQLEGAAIRAHHLNVERVRDMLSVTSATPDIQFLFRNQNCKQATLGPGDSFAIDSITLYCQSIAAEERTQLNIGARASTAAAAVVSTSAPKMERLQVSGFVTQKVIDRWPFLIGRNERCNLALNHPLVSAFHARLKKTSQGVVIEDLHSSNGTFVADTPVRRTLLQPADTILIMPYLLLFTGDRINVYTFQQESRLIGWQVQMAAGTKKILERVTLSCGSGELVGLIGPSGSGKTTLMKCLSGQMVPTAGRVQLNDLEIFSHYDAFKHNIGFVPQDDIIHRELTVSETLMYAARLRLPADMTDKERKIRVKETLIELELEEQERLAVHRLSGGQRKRVNIAIELLTKPGILFLDEPTSGLDPALDEKLMLLFKKLSQDGRITILTTHLLEHASVLSKIALMHSGRLIFFGSPDHATQFFDVPSLGALYNRIKTRPAEQWQEEFQKSETVQQETVRIRDAILPSKRQVAAPPQKSRESLWSQVRQAKTLAERYLDIILRDHKNTGILLLQAPLIASFILLATTNLSSRLFMMALAAIWFGCNNSAREICKELSLYRRERMVNLGIIPYLVSKVSVLTALVIIQCIVLGLLTPREFWSAYPPLVLCGVAGIALGLLVSAIVDSPDKAIALVPILLIPQVLFSGIFGEMKGFQSAMGDVMISKWSYNLLKKEFALPSFELKKELERDIDSSQQTLQDSLERVTKLQKQVDQILADMEDSIDPVELDTLRFDAEQKMSEMKKEQTKMENAQKTLRASEKKLRANSKLFVWIDRPNSRASDWIALWAYVIVLLTACAIQMKRRDRTLKML